MNSSQIEPPVLIARALLFMLQKRIRFEKDIVGTISYEYEDDYYEVFRKIILDPKGDQPKKPGAVFRVTFNFSSFSIPTNKKLSLLPIPFIIGQPGFRSKTWMIGKKTGKFLGLYEWDTLESAKDYWNSFPLKLMKRRSVPESLHYEIHAIDE